MPFTRHHRTHHMRLVVSLIAVGVSSVGCLDLTVPPVPPPPGPGTVQGTVVYAVAGRSGYQPAGGASLQVLGTTLATQADATSGRFVLGGLKVDTGQLLITFDADGDGQVDRQKLLTLEQLMAGPGRDVALGEVPLGQNATVVGRVKRSDDPLPTGHGGTSVFVPGAPYATSTADDGSFLLGELPEGPVRLAFLHEGYGVESRELEVKGGEESRVAEVSLSPAPAGQAEARGRVVLDDGASGSSAHVRFAVAGVETTTDCDLEGAFSVQGLRPSVYQAAIERPGAVSLRLYNLLLTAGTNELGTFALSPGTSTPLGLDGGLSVADAGPAPLAAVVDRATLDVDPGSVAVLGGARSTGERPLVFHWRQDVDGGAAVTLSDNDSATAIAPSFTAPATPGVLGFELTVADALGALSAPARTVVRVGRRPTADLLASSATVTSGDLVTLSAFGSASTDGSPLVTFLYQQLSGPFVPELNGPNGQGLMFVAPAVSAPTPLSVQLVVVTAVGRQSQPASVTLVVEPQPDWGVRVTATPASVDVGPDGGQVVRLTASVTHPPPGATFDFAWSPASRPCSIGADGGADFSCPYAFTLSNPDAGLTEFVPPRVDGTSALQFDVQVTNRLDRSVRNGTTSVQLRDLRPPTCVASLGQLTLRIDCDEPLADGGTLSFYPPASYRLAVTDRQLVASFDAPLAPGASLDVFAAGLSDKAGNLAPDVVGTLLASGSGPVYLSQGTSASEPRPGWAVTGGGSSSNQPARRQVFGRRTDATNRMAWSMDPNVGCGTPPCNAPDQTAMSIPGLGSLPTAPDTVLAVGTRTYLLVSPSGPPSLMELSQGNWQEVSGAPMGLLTMATDGSALQVVATHPTPGQAGGLQRFSYEPTTRQWASPEVIVAAPTDPFGSAASVSLNLPVGENPVAHAISLSGALARFVRGAAAWSSAPLGSANNPVEVEAVSMGGTSLIFTRDGAGTLSSTGAPPAAAWTRPSVSPGFDVEPYGPHFLVTYASNGRIFVGLVDGSTHIFSPVSSSEPDGAWNTALTSGSHPNLTVLDGELGLAWQEQQGAQYKMAARLLR